MLIKEICCYVVSKEEVVKRDTRKFSNKIKELQKEGTESKSKLYVVFEGFNTAEIFEVPEIRTYVKKLYKKHPYFIYFLDDALKNDFLLLTCLAKVNKVVRENNEVVDIDMTISDTMKLEIINAVLYYCFYDGETFESLEEKLDVLMYF